MLSQLTVGWLILVAAIVAFAGGFGLRSLVARKRQSAFVRRFVRGARESRFGRVMFGPVAHDALDDEELDQMILMPTIIVACGLCLTSVFLLGYEVLT
ncbi:MAG: hypothetical protein ABW137_02425 [Mycobacterium sp.]